MATDDEDAVRALRRWFEREFGDLARLDAVLCQQLEGLSQPADDVVTLARVGRDVIQRHSRQYLREHPHADGVGMIFSRSTRGDGRGVIEWWERDRGRGASRYSFGINPAGDRFYDYEELEWFQTSFASGRPWLTGPYIDYLGVDEYVITLTTRSVVHGRPIGVAAVDITLEALERQLVPLLRALDGEAAVLSPHGSVLAGSGATFLVGDVLESAPDGYRITPLRVGDDDVALLHSVPSA